MSKLNLDSLKISQNFREAQGSRKVLNNIPLRKGLRQTFLRAHPDPETSPDLFVLDLKEGESETFVISQELVGSLGKEGVVKRFYYCIDQFGNAFFWPVKIVFGDDRLDSWNESAHRAVTIARDKWIRISANRHIGSYDVFEALGEIPEPKWPEQSAKELLEVAFADRYIDSLDHPIVKRLQGVV